MSGTYDGSSDWLSWYKKNYGTEYDKATGFTRKDGMSDGDYNVGQMLYQNYINTEGLKDNQAKWETDFNSLVDSQKKSVSDSYAGMRSTLGQNKNSALQAADITYERLKKYLPMQAHAQGKSGLGATASTGLQAYNAYINEAGAINKNYADNMRQINEAEASKVNELENYRSSTLTDSRKTLNDAIAKSNQSTGETALDYYRKWQDEKDAEHKAAAQAYIDAYSGTDSAELEAWLKKHYGIEEPVATVDENGNPVMTGGYTGGNEEYDTMLAKAKKRTNDNTENERIKRNTEADAYINAYSGTDQAALEAWLKNQYGIGDDYVSGSDTDYDTMLAAARDKTGNNVIQKGVNTTNLANILQSYTTAAEKLNVLKEYKGLVSDAEYNNQLATLTEEARIEELTKDAKSSNTANVRWEKGDAPNGPNNRFVAFMDNEDGGRTKLVLETAGEVTDGDAYIIGQNIDTGVLFAYDGKMYIKNEDGRVFGVQMRNSARSTSYESALKALGLK